MTHFVRGEVVMLSVLFMRYLVKCSVEVSSVIKCDNICTKMKRL